MKTKREPRYIIDMLFVLALFAMFAISSVLLIAIGTSVYRQGSAAMEENNEVRTAYAYVSEKIRRADAEGLIETGAFGDADALLLRYYINDISYTTYLYVHEGMLTELVARSDLSFSPSAGQPVTELMKLKCQTLDDNLLKITLIEEGGEERVLMAHLRTAASGGS